jgi:acetylornithine/succinyldiaminopimelate/putrescine aminotransferase
MGGYEDLLAIAALLERVHLWAHLLQSEGMLEMESRQFVASELVQVLDEAHVALFAASGTEPVERWR